MSHSNFFEEVVGEGEKETWQLIMTELEQTHDIEADINPSTPALSFISPSGEGDSTDKRRLLGVDEEDEVVYAREETQQTQQSQQKGEEFTFSFLHYEFQIGGVKRLKLHVVARILTIGFWMLALAFLFLWQFMVPFSVGMMATGYTFVVLSIILTWVVSILNDKNRERTLLYSVHRAAYLSISAFLLILNVSLWHLEVTNFLKECASQLWDDECDKRRAPKVFNIWAIYPILFWGHLFAFHYLREFKMFNWWEYHKFSFTAVNSALIFIWALGHYNVPYKTEDPWFLLVLLPWAGILALHFLILQVDWDHGVKFTLWGFNFQAVRTAASEKREA